MQIENKHYLNLVRELSCGRLMGVLDVLNNYSIEQLEELAVMEWDSYLGETMYNATMLCRKKKLNEQFVFSPENIHALVSLDQLFKETCRQLKNDLEKELNHLVVRKKQNPNTFFFSIEACIKIGYYKSLTYNSFLDCAHNVYNESISYFGVSQSKLSLSINEKFWPEKLDELPVFDLTTNFADQFSANNILTGRHIGFAFYHFYSESLFSLQDMLEIDTLEVEITPHFTVKVSLQNENAKTNKAAK